VVTAPTITNTPNFTNTPAPVVPTQNPATTVAHSPSTHPTAVKPSPTKTVQIGGAAASRTAMAPVVVLNNSTISGLAAQVASELRSKGWHIKSVGNQQGIIPVTTLYFASGERAAALHLASEFSQIQRVRSAAQAGITSYGNNLTLVVTRDWP